nr:uncharacterized protein LOC103426825 [Malus domestica]
MTKKKDTKQPAYACSGRISHFTSVPLIRSNLKRSSLPHRALISSLCVEFRPATGPPPHHTISSDSPAFLHHAATATPPLSLSRDLSLSGDFLSHHRTLDPAPAPNSAATVLYLFFGLRLFYIAWRSSDSKSSQKKEIEEAHWFSLELAMKVLGIYEKWE